MDKELLFYCLFIVYRVTPSNLVVWFPRRPKHIYKDYVQRFIKNIYIIHIYNYILKYNIDVKLYYMLLNI